MSNIKFVSVSQNIAEDLSIESYRVDVSCANGLQVAYIGKRLSSVTTGFIFKDEEIVDVFFDGDLVVVTKFGGFVLFDVLEVYSV